MTDYVVLECRDTLEFMRWGMDKFEVWTPTEMVEVEVGPKGRKRKEMRRYAAMQGYAFAPAHNWVPLRRAVPAQFNMNALEYDSVARPKTCTLKELILMDNVLKGDLEATVDAYIRGDIVTITTPPFIGYTGVVACSGEKDTLRLLIGTRHVNIPKKLVKHTI